ncbi:juvenile hormone esterase-like [Anticarsia gemmatalis]|uniref:juvenile hormone esterase-like n=1 Tax=Anticarsia gemmatalis TaxID=129554 RepID=UPI003F769A18
MMFRFIVFFTCACFATANEESDLRCNIRTRVDTGWVCGLVRKADHGVEYASFRGIPYARQPLGELRFQELKPAKPWVHLLDATEEGPICPQHDEIYGRLVKPIRGMSESCIFVNVHVPVSAMPKVFKAEDDFSNATIEYKKPGLPIYVFIHGGGFQQGSGNSDLYGPEYLVSKGIIVITFNYRIGVFGFLSLSNPKIPDNAGLRDMVTLLRWVQRNARAFGGNPRDVTIGGQSAGASCAHLLALSNATKGLFKRVILMSGSAITSFYTTSPIYATYVAGIFFKHLGFNSTDPDIIHQRLTQIPLEDILNILGPFQYETGLAGFSPVQEPKYPGITQIVDDDPIRLIEKGRDKEYPMIIGFTSNECQFFKYRLMELQMLRRIQMNPTMILRLGYTLTVPPNVALYLANRTIEEYFDKKLNYDEYIEEACRDVLFAYPAFQLARWRSEMNAAPSFLYQFQYEADFSVIKKALYLQYRGSSHVEDLTYVFRENAVLGHESLPPRDDKMTDWMSDFIVKFVLCNDPSCGKGWPPVKPWILNYQSVHEPGVYYNTPPTPKEMDRIRFNDEIDQIARNSSITGVFPPQAPFIPPIVTSSSPNTFPQGPFMPPFVPSSSSSPMSPEGPFIPPFVPSSAPPASFQPFVPTDANKS